MRIKGRRNVGIPESITCKKCGRKTRSFIHKRMLCGICNSHMASLERQIRSPKVPCGCGCGQMMHSITTTGKPSACIDGHQGDLSKRLKNDADKSAKSTEKQAA